jgi:hypothetical protein
MAAAPTEEEEEEEEGLEVEERPSSWLLSLCLPSSRATARACPLSLPAEPSRSRKRVA